MDIALDLDPTSPTFGDVLFQNGDLVLIDGRDAIRQDVIQRLRSFQGEWFLDTTWGVPYFQQIFVPNYDQSKIDALFIDTILGTPGVTQLDSYSFSIDRATRVLTISFRAETTSGTIQYNGPVPT